jgi:hypothetical protein
MPTRMFLDDGERFGFMRRTKACYCISCSVNIAAGVSRLYDNTNKSGPHCEVCSRRTLNFDSPLQVTTTSLNAPASPSVLSPDLDKRLEHAREQIERLQAEIETFAATSDNILSRLRRLETFHKSQDQKQGFIWQTHISKFGADNKDTTKEG